MPEIFAWGVELGHTEDDVAELLQGKKSEKGSADATLLTYEDGTQALEGSWDRRTAKVIINRIAQKLGREVEVVSVSLPSDRLRKIPEAAAEGVEPLPPGIVATARHRVNARSQWRRVEDVDEDPVYIAGDAKETVQAALAERFSHLGDVVDTKDIRGIAVPEPTASNGLSERLQTVCENILAVGAYQVQMRGNTRFISVKTASGGQQMSAVSEQELDAVAAATGLRPSA